MNVRQVGMSLLQLVDEVRELRDRVLHAHVLVQHPRAQPDRSLRLPDGLDDRVHDLEREPCAVLDRPPVLVRALVRNVLEELVYEIAGCAVDFDSVETGAINRVLGGRRVPLDVLLDLCRSSGSSVPTKMSARKQRNNAPSFVSSRGTWSG